MSVERRGLGRVLIFGAGGQLGQALVAGLAGEAEVLALTREDCDLTDEGAVHEAIVAAQPAVIINAAAYTAVDRAEDERDQAFVVNADAPGGMAKEARQVGAIFIHYSTDYVFDGSARVPYSETDEPVPLGVYGASKREGERRVLAAGGCAYVLRTAWLYARSGHNFLTTIERLARERAQKDGKPLTIVADQYGSPTTAGALAAATGAILRHRAVRELSGLYHATCAGETTWHGFAQAIVQRLDIPVAVKPIATADYPTPARRPGYSVLSGVHLKEVFGIALPPWEEALAACLRVQP